MAEPFGPDNLTGSYAAFEAVGKDIVVVTRDNDMTANTGADYEATTKLISSVSTIVMASTPNANGATWFVEGVSSDGSEITALESDLDAVAAGNTAIVTLAGVVTAA
jgi:hypothetical protein